MQGNVRKFDHLNAKSSALDAFKAAPVGAFEVGYSTYFFFVRFLVFGIHAILMITYGHTKAKL